MYRVANILCVLRNSSVPFSILVSNIFLIVLFSQSVCVSCSVWEIGTKSSYLKSFSFSDLFCKLKKTRMPCLERKHVVWAYLQSPLFIINILLVYITEKLQLRYLTVKGRKSFLCSVSVLFLAYLHCYTFDWQTQILTGTGSNTGYYWRKFEVDLDACYKYHMKQNKIWDQCVSATTSCSDRFTPEKNSPNTCWG
jgi:hypothetical protein